MWSHRDEPVIPRNGHTVVAGIVARISGCQNQKEMSLEDQEDHGREIVADYYPGPAEFRVIATRGKGEDDLVSSRSGRKLFLLNRLNLYKENECLQGVPLLRSYVKGYERS